MKKKLLPKGQLGLKLLRSIVKSSKILPKKSILKTGDFKWSNKDTKDFLNKYFASQQISGNDFGLTMNNVTTGLPDHVITHLSENTIERNIRAMRNAGYSERAIEQYKQHLNELMHKVKVGQYSGKTYSDADADFDGFYNDDKFFISVNKDSKRFTPSQILKHEGRHMIDYRSDMPNELHKYLSDAYDDDFINLPNNSDEGLKGYKHMDRERVTTNRDARDYLLQFSWNEVPTNSVKYSQDPLSKGIPDMIDGQNAVIDDASDEEIFAAVKNANGYGRRYIEYLKKNGKLTPEKADQFRKAMMYVGGYALPVVSGVTLMWNQDKNNKQK